MRKRSGHDFSPSWSPDGDRIVFARMGERGTRSLGIMDASGGELARLAPGYHRVTEPAWSPGGRLIAFAGIPEEGGTYQLFVARVP